MVYMKYYNFLIYYVQQKTDVKIKLFLQLEIS